MQENVDQPSFSEMMGRFPRGINPSDEKFTLYDEEELDFLEEEYKKKIASLFTAGKQKIPKILHFIWIGQKAFPEDSTQNVLSWKKYHPDWEIYFWTDSKDPSSPVPDMKKKLIKEYDFGILQKYIEKASSIKEKAHLMSIAILNNMGGFYINHDAKALRSFDPFLHYDSVICLDYLHFHGGAAGSSVLFQNDLFGITPQHPFMQIFMQKIVHIWEELDVHYPEEVISAPAKTIRRTFDSFTLSIKEALNEKEHRIKYNDLLLPTCYFFPSKVLSPQDIQRFEEKGVIWALDSTSFLEMMGLSERGKNAHKDTLSQADFNELEIIEKNYKKDILQLSQSGKTKIPKIFHFIWIGPKPFPSESINCVLSWKKHHPDWKIYFWTDSKDCPCPIPDMEKRLVQEYDFGILQKYIPLTPHYAEKTDLMRYVILNNIGGFYVDHDMGALRSFTPFFQYDFVACCEFPHKHEGAKGSSIVFQNALFGSAPNHPVLTKTMQNVIKIWQDLEERFPDNGKPTPDWKIIWRTFDSFTLAIKEEFFEKNEPAQYSKIVLPTCYFFPDWILSPEDIRFFQEKGLVWASHKYTRTWQVGRFV